MIYIRTYAYNAEKTLEKTIKSVLNQTYKEFRYYLLDNGATDGTREVIRKYAEEDNRIVPFYCDVNFDYSKNRDFWDLPRNLNEEDYFCIIDADDTYEPTFFEEMLRFLEENHLDIAICGSTFIDAATGEARGDRVFNKELILPDASAFDFCFPQIHWNLRQYWGKLYRGKVTKVSFYTEFPEWFPKAYGGDTIYVYDCVKASERIGIYNKAFHNYYLSGGSVSYRWKDGRENVEFVLFQKAKELLIEKCGQVSSKNLCFLYATLFNGLRDTFRVLFRSDLETEEKLNILGRVFENADTKQVFLKENVVTREEKTELLAELACGVIELAKDVEDASLREVFELFRVFNRDFGELISSESLGWYLKKLPVVVRNIALGEYEYGMNNLIVYLVKQREPGLAVDYPFVLGQMLASIREEEAKYVFFSKQLICWCLEHNQTERARQDLEEWMQILPGDKELLELSQRCL